MKWLSLLLCCFIFVSSIAQECQGTYNPYDFNVNKIKTGFIPLGEKFVLGETGGSYLVPFPEFQFASTLSSGSAWIASRGTHQLRNYPEDTTGLFYDDGFFRPNHGDYFPSLTYAFVSTAGENFSIASGTRLLRIPFGIINKLQLPLGYLPDTVHIRLKNLVGIDKAGRNLQLGSYDLDIPNALLTSAADVDQSVIEVFPNPAGNQLSVVCPHQDEVTLFNCLGQLTQTQKIDSDISSIDIASLPSGMYVIYFREAGMVKRFLKI